MSGRTCCKRGGEVAGWILPAATLVVLPKCPACVAAYIALATGVGVSFSTAAWIRISVMVICVLLLAGLGVRRGIRWWSRGFKAEAVDRAGSVG